MTVKELIEQLNIVDPETPVELMIGCDVYGESEWDDLQLVVLHRVEDRQTGGHKVVSVRLKG